MEITLSTYIPQFTSGMGKFEAKWKAFRADEIGRVAEQLAAEAQAQNPGYQAAMYFSYRNCEFSSFNAAGVWIK